LRRGERNDVTSTSGLAFSLGETNPA